MRVFLVEDQEHIRIRIRLAIEAIGACVVGEAATENYAVECLLETAVDLVVVDLGLEEGSGIGVIRRLREKNPDVIIVVLSAVNRLMYERHCVEAGANYFMDKTLDFVRFVNLIKNLKHNYDIRTRFNNESQ